jgi:urease accessory protein
MSLVFTLSGSYANNPSDRDLQRGEGCGRIVIGNARNGNRLVDLYQRSPVRIMFPRVDGRCMREAVLINTSGGIAGGDRLEFVVTALPRAAISVTSQAAEKVYRALQESARIVTRLKACTEAQLAWLPQETIVFDGGRFRRETEIDVCSGAEVLALESLVLGRAAHGERVTGGHITESWRVKKDGRLIFADCFRVTDKTFAQLGRNALLARCNAIATLVYFGPDVDSRLIHLRDIARSLPCHCAATCVNGLIIVRFAAEMSSPLRLALRTLLEQFGHLLQRTSFGIPKMWSC